MLSILVAALLGSFQAPTIQPAEDVVVTARRLKEWRGNAQMRSGSVRCKTLRSTGDTELDTIACDSLRWCMVSLTPEAAFLQDKKLPAAERARRTRLLNDRLAACGEDQQQRRVAVLLDARAAARTK